MTNFESHPAGAGYRVRTRVARGVREMRVGIRARSRIASDPAACSSAKG